MDQHFFRIPFAANGDKESIPEAVNSEGYVSFTSGYGEDYAKDPGADAHAKPVERESMNFVLNAITSAVRQYQTHGYPEWITTADNNGAAFGYDAGVVVFYNGALYLSLVAGNATTPGADIAKWQPYIQREATEDEALEGTGSTQSMTPRRVKSLASSLDEQVINELKQQIAPVTVPIGGCMLWFTPTPPEGWLEGNGGAFDTVKNPKLHAIYPSGRVPDMRGYVPRGWANGSTVDSEPSRAIGSIQDDAIVNIKGSFVADVASMSGVNKTTGVFSDDGDTGYPADTGSIKSPEVRKISFDASREVNTATEVRVKNIATMFIFKSDQAEEQETSVVPTAIVLSPSTVTIQVAKTQQFTATVLPSSLAGNYPVSWAVSDAALGSINNTGLYTATGAAGTQTVIASISTGLSSTATVTQDIWLANINIGAIPTELLSGQTYDIAITYSPATFTESVIAASSDTSVATLTSGGTLSVLSAGTTTLSLTGSQSGVTASVIVNTQEAVVDEIYLQIANNLSEIADAGEEAQAEARGYLKLGALATKDSLTAGDVGAAPMATVSLPQDLDLNKLTMPGDYFQNVSSYATEENHYPETVAGAIRVVATGVDEGGCRQFYWPYNSGVEFRRYAYGDPLVFSEWMPY
jgi:Bacterial surface proteins containing Ig-like domains